MDGVTVSTAPIHKAIRACFRLPLVRSRCRHWHSLVDAPTIECMGLDNYPEDFEVYV